MQTVNREDLGWVVENGVHTIEFGKFSIRYYPVGESRDKSRAYFFTGNDFQGIKLDLVGTTDDERKAEAIEKAYRSLKKELKAFWAKAAQMGVRIDD